MRIYLKFYGAIGTVSDDFDITYIITGEDAASAVKVQYLISDVTIASGIEHLTFYPMTNLEETAQIETDVTTTITVEDIQTALSKSGVPSNGAYVLKLSLLDSSDEEIESASQIFVWQNETLKIDLGEVTAFGAAKRGGFTGDYDLFCKSMAAFANNAYMLAELGRYTFYVDNEESETSNYLDDTYYGLYNSEFTAWSDLSNSGIFTVEQI